MDTIIIAAGYVIIGYFGFKIGQIYENYKTEKLVDELLSNGELRDEIDKIAHKFEPSSTKSINAHSRKLKYEIIDDIYYFYFEDDDSFACQGDTLDVAARNFSLQHGHKFAGLLLINDINYAFYCGNCEQIEIRQG